MLGFYSVSRLDSHLGERDGSTADEGLSEAGVIIRKQRQAKGLTLAQVASAVGCQKGYLSMVERGRRNLPARPLLDRLESTLGFPTGSLIDLAERRATPARLRRRLADLERRHQRAREFARTLTDNEACDLDALLSSGALHRFVESHAPNIGAATPVTRQIPLVNRVTAGQPADFTDLDYPPGIADEYVPAPPLPSPASSPTTQDDTFAARVIGTSMEPEYHEDDVVIFSPNAPTPDGCDCFVRFVRDDETTFKRVHFVDGDSGSRVRLNPLNPAFEPRTVNRTDIALLCAAVYVMRPVR